MKTSSFRNFFWIVVLSFLPVMSSCSGASDSPDDDDEENTVITAPFSGKECMYYEVEAYFETPKEAHHLEKRGHPLAKVSSSGLPWSLFLPCLKS